jgi:hypothetical protein
VSAEQPPGREFTGWAELRYAIGELQALSVQLGVQLHSGEEDPSALIWDEGTWRAADLLERTLADLGTLAGRYVRLKIRDRGLP